MPIKLCEEYKAQQRTESRLASNRFRQREVKAYNELGLGPRIPIARDPNDQATVEFAHNALQGNTRVVHDLSERAANLLRDTPRVRSRYPHLPKIRDGDIPKNTKRVEAQHIHDYERHAKHLEKQYAEQIRNLIDQPPNNENSQDGSLLSRPPIPGSESEHDSE